MQIQHQGRSIQLDAYLNKTTINLINRVDVQNKAVVGITTYSSHVILSPFYQSYYVLTIL